MAHRRWTTFTLAPASLLVLVGCTHPSSSPMTPAPSTVRSATTSSAEDPSSSGPSSSFSPSNPATTASPTPVDLCAGTDRPQDAADSYIGSISAGDVMQAQNCVLPGTVPESTTRSLVAPTSRTAVYLPDDTAGSGSVFVYKGNGKTVSVTVGTEPDGRFFVIAVDIA